MKKQILNVLTLFCLIGISMIWHACQKENGFVESVDALTKTELLQYESIPFINELKVTETPTVTDVDGNVYQTVQIGEQVWMTENLKTTKFKNGTTILLVTDNAAWSNLSSAGYTGYNNNRRIGNVFGALYNWYTVETGNLCPTGWHVPTDAEWTTLTNYLGGSHVAGGKLKEGGTTHWYSPNAGATNESGFTAFGGGFRNRFGEFRDIGNLGYWWSATETSNSPITHARVLHLTHVTGGAYNFGQNKKIGFSVRCVKN